MGQLASARFVEFAIGMGKSKRLQDAFADFLGVVTAGDTIEDQAQQQEVRVRVVELLAGREVGGFVEGVAQLA